MASLSHLEILVEEPSAEAAMTHLVPKLLGEVSFAVYPHRGKRDLMRRLPDRLRGYRRWLPDDWGIVVLADSDGQDCRQQKAMLEGMARDAGFLTRTAARDGRFQILNRLAVEELEAWFFGDVDALCEAYPGVPRNLGDQTSYRDPDAIRGGTWEALERELQKAGHHPGGLAKIIAAREISAQMDPDRNRSRSFKAFREGLLALAGD